MSNGLPERRITEHRPGPSRLLAALRFLGRRGSSALEDAYARGASSVLERLERVDDEIAERRFLQHAKMRGATKRGQAAREATAKDEPLPTRDESGERAPR